MPTCQRQSINSSRTLIRILLSMICHPPLSVHNNKSFWVGYVLSFIQATTYRPQVQLKSIIDFEESHL